MSGRSSDDMSITPLLRRRGLVIGGAVRACEADAYRLLWSGLIGTLGGVLNRR